MGFWILQQQSRAQAFSVQVSAGWKQSCAALYTQCVFWWPRGNQQVSKWLIQKPNNFIMKSYNHSKPWIPFEQAERYASSEIILTPLWKRRKKDHGDKNPFYVKKGKPQELVTLPPAAAAIKAKRLSVGFHFWSSPAVASWICGSALTSWLLGCFWAARLWHLKNANPWSLLCPWPTPAW